MDDAAGSLYKRGTYMGTQKETRRCVCMINNAAEGNLLPETRFYTDFIMAGQDAFAMVAFLVNFR